MEKTVIGTAGAILIAWLGTLTGTKVDKTACEATHKGACEKLDMLLQRQEEHGNDVSYIRQRLDQHIDNSQSKLVM
jgi:hypothetical protein